MRRLLNTLFVTTSDAYLSLDGENVVVSREKQELGRFPLHNLCGVISFSYAGASPALLGACAERDIDVVFCSPQGRFLARTAGITGGNVLLRRTIRAEPAASRGTWSTASCTTPGGTSSAPGGITGCASTRRDSEVRRRR